MNTFSNIKKITVEKSEIFERLQKRREKIADALDDPAVRGFKSSVVEKYTEMRTLFMSFSKMLMIPKLKKPGLF